MRHLTSSGDSALIFPERQPGVWNFSSPDRKLCFGSRLFGLRIDHAGLSHIEIIEHVLTSIELLLEVPCCRSVSLRFFHRCRSRLEWMTSISEKILELLDCQAGVADDRRHRIASTGLFRGTTTRVVPFDMKTCLPCRSIRNPDFSSALISRR